MKLPYLILTFLTFLTFEGTSQEISISTENSEELNTFAQSIRNIETFYNAEPQPIYIRLFECGRLIGSLSYGADVILYDFYISVKQATDNNSRGELGWFWVTGHFIDPRNYKFNPLSNTLSFEHGTEDSAATTTLSVSYNAIIVE